MRNDAIEQIRERLDIVEVVREYVPTLRKAGRGHKACCPFHQERTPSFTVSQEKQLWYCFGSCHDGGDLFKFVMKAEGLSFTEAAERLAQRAGVQWRPSPEQLGPQERARLQLREALEFAKDYYRRLLEGSPEADMARKYLVRRGVSSESRERFELGVALTDGTSFLEAGLRKGFTAQILQKAGLVAEREGGKFRDYFRGRLLFPIRDARGAVVGFGGRALGDYEPKYLNTPETPVFNKGATLYGLYQAGPTLRKEGKAMLVEGYMDVLGCHQHGLTNAVAPLGTAVTPDHARMLKRYVGDVLLVFDPDAAGISASVRGSELLIEAGLFTKIGSVPDGKDPDEFLKEQGPEALKKALEQAVDPADFKTEVELSRLPRPSLEDKARIASQVMETIAKQPDQILRGEWLKRLASRLGLDEASLRLEWSRKGRSEKAKIRKAPPAPAQSGVLGAEEELLQLLLKHPELLAKAGDLKPEDFASERCRKAWAGIIALGAEEDWPQRLAASEEGAWLSKLLVQDRDYPRPEEALKAMVEGLRRVNQDEGRLKQLTADVVAMMSGKKPKDEAVIAQYQAMLAKLKGSKTA